MGKFCLTWPQMTRALILLAAIALMVFAVFGLARPSFAQEVRCAPHNAIATSTRLHFTSAS